MKKYIIFFSFFSIAVIILVVYSAGLSRQQQSDKIKSDDLSSIRRTIDDYAYDNNRLPGTLSEIELECVKDYSSNGPSIFGGSTVKDNCIADRVNAYQYNKTAYNTYELCANFTLDTAGRTAKKSQNNNIDSNYIDTALHTKGNQCFKYWVNIQDPFFQKLEKSSQQPNRFDIKSLDFGKSSNSNNN